MKTFYYCSAFLAALLLGSCTIEKRLHQSGWHVEWKKQLPAREGETTPGDFQTTGDLTAGTGVRPVKNVDTHKDEDASGIVPEQSPSEVPETTLANLKPAEPIANRSVATPLTDDTLKRKVIVVNESELGKRPAEQASGERDPLTTPLWILSVLSILLITALALLILFASPSSVMTLVLLFAEFPFLILARTILAIFIRKRERDQPGRFRHSENVILAVILPEIYLIFAFFMTIIAAILIFA